MRLRARFQSLLLAALVPCLLAFLFGFTNPDTERSSAMGNAIRVENVSNADQELAPGSGFIPAHGFAVYPIDVFREKHAQYAEARVQADPPILKLTEVDSSEVAQRDETQKAPAVEPEPRAQGDAKTPEEAKAREEAEQRAKAEAEQRAQEEQRRTVPGGEEPSRHEGPHKRR